MNATVSDLIPVTFNDRADMGKWLTVACPNGWDDVKKLTKKVLVYNGETYVWRSWNSDRNESYFIQSNEVANIRKRS